MRQQKKQKQHAQKPTFGCRTGKTGSRERLFSGWRCRCLNTTHKQRAVKPVEHRSTQIDLNTFIGRPSVLVPLKRRGSCATNRGQGAQFVLQVLENNRLDLRMVIHQRDDVRHILEQGGLTSDGKHVRSELVPCQLATIKTHLLVCTSSFATSSSESEASACMCVHRYASAPAYRQTRYLLGGGFLPAGHLSEARHPGVV